MKRLSVAGLALLLGVVALPSAGAGVRVGFWFGSPCYYSPYWYHCDPYWRSSYCWGPPVYCYPAPVVYEYPAPQVVYVPAQPAPSSQSPAPAISSGEDSSQTSTTYYRLGRDWAQDLRNEVATRDQFVEYLKTNSLEASPVNFSEFRKGFLSAYGVNGAAAFDKAVRQTHDKKS